MNAVVFEQPRMIVFSADPMPDHLRGELLGEMGATIGEGVKLEIPEDVHEWPSGADRPEDVLAVARDEPRHFRVFKYRREIDQAQYEPTGMNYAVVPSWEGFLKAYRPLDKISRITDASDRPGLDEEIMHNLTGSTH